VNKKDFWELIEEARSFENSNEWLIDELASKNIDQIVAFEFHFRSLMNESYQSRLWAGAYILMGGCSDDAFDYFRGWLIAQGEEPYNISLQDPEFLATYIKEEYLDEEGYPQNENLLSVGLDAYTFKKTGELEWVEEIHDELIKELDKKGLKDANEIEFDWEEENLEEMFPILWRKFGENPLG
jgi:hypothetical protein